MGIGSQWHKQGCNGMFASLRALQGPPPISQAAMNLAFEEESGLYMSPTEMLHAPAETHTPVSKKAITEPRVLNEAYEYAKPSSFSRGLRLDIKGVTILMISGTASIDEFGKTVHVGDFRAQMARTLHNITGLLTAEGATWKDVVRTSCYLRDIERDYDEFNKVRTQFFREQGLDPLPASTGIQAILCRPDLLIEIEAMAMFESDRPNR
jgi:2-iminobutanoate/2-iminopropanoate deaminase